MDIRHAVGVKAGVPAEKLAEVLDYHGNPRFSAREQAALEFCERTTRDDLEVTDACRARLREHFSEPEIVELGKGITADDLLFHNEKSPEPTLAYLLSRMRHPEFPEPIGVFRAVDAPKYDVELNRQIESAREKRGEGDLNALFNSGETWTVA